MKTCGTWENLLRNENHFSIERYLNVWYIAIEVRNR